MKRFRIVHSTEYRFSRPVSACRLEARLRPRKMAGQRCTYFQITTRPPSEARQGASDRFGNPVDHLQIQGVLQRLLISAISTVEIRVPRGSREVSSNSWQAVVQQIIPNPDSRLFCQSTTLASASPKMAHYARTVFVKDKPLLTAAADLTKKIHSDMRFRSGATDVQTSAAEVLEKGQGVCQDFAHLAVACLRSLGLAARYVSGYLYTAASRGKVHRIAGDASHAWFEVLDPQSGWVGFDPTIGLPVDDHYIAVAWGRDYNDACPLRGTAEGGGAHRMHVSVDVQEIRG